MKPTLFIAFLLLALPPGLRAQSVLDAYVAEGIASNEALRVQEIQLDKSLSALRQAKGLFLPTANLLGTYTLAEGGRSIALPVGDLLNPVYSTLNQLTQSSSFPQIENVEEQFNPNNFYDLRVRTAWPVVNAEIRANKRIREGLIPLEEAKLAVMKRELTRDIKMAYFAYLQAEEAVSIYDNALELLAENVRVNEVLAQNGMASPGLIIKANSERSRVEGQREEARNQALNAAAYLNFLLNRDLLTPVTIDSTYFGELPEQSSGGVAGKREELAQLAAAREVQSQVTTLARSWATPKVNLFLDLGSQGFNFQVGDGASYLLGGVSLDIPLYAGGTNREKIRQAELELESIEEQTRQAERQLELQLSIARNNLAAAYAAMESASSGETGARRYLQDTWKRYREQQVLYIELLEAQTSATQARLQASIARFQVWTRIAEVERAL